MKLQPSLIVGLIMLVASFVYAQPQQGLIIKDTKSENRNRLYKSLVAGINRNLSLTLADSTEEAWMDALFNMELLQYRTPWSAGRIRVGFSGIRSRSIYFQRSLAEAVYALYPIDYFAEIQALFRQTKDAKTTAICSEYLLRNKATMLQELEDSLQLRLQRDTFVNNPTADRAVYGCLRNRLTAMHQSEALPSLRGLFKHAFPDSAVVLFSIQRRNRDYPGLVIIRGKDGRFLKDAYGNLFSLPQLARSISNLPGYLTNGNTPQGIFRLKGIGVSRSIFIGPTPNLQLCMPVECSTRQFYGDSTTIDTAWSREKYGELLPADWKAYQPIYESWFAGAAGRTEIIAHGTTVDPTWYRNLPCYPLTPTLGCLCTIELWNPETGSRMRSDQQLLADAVQQAGGADGYLVVVELDDRSAPVQLSDIRPYLD